MFSMETKTKLRIGAKFHGVIDFFFGDKENIRGAFNKQEARKSLFKELMDSFDFDCIVETGTFLGETSKYMSCISGKKVYTCESSYQFWAFAKLNCLFKRVKIYNETSVKFLKKIFPKIRNKKVFFYLDAHDPSNDPLIEELQFVLDNFKNPIIMIDDFKHPQYSGYGYDNNHHIEYLRMKLPKHNVFFMFPQTPPQLETGAMRGCVVIYSNLEDLAKYWAFKKPVASIPNPLPSI